MKTIFDIPALNRQLKQLTTELATMKAECDKLRVLQSTAKSVDAIAKMKQSHTIEPATMKSNYETAIEKLKANHSAEINNLTSKSCDFDAKVNKTAISMLARKGDVDISIEPDVDPLKANKPKSKYNIRTI